MPRTSLKPLLLFYKYVTRFTTGWQDAVEIWALFGVFSILIRICSWLNVCCIVDTGLHWTCFLNTEWENKTANSSQSLLHGEQVNTRNRRKYCNLLNGKKNSDYKGIGSIINRFKIHEALIQGRGLVIAKKHTLLK